MSHQRPAWGNNAQWQQRGGTNGGYTAPAASNGSAPTASSQLQAPSIQISPLAAGEPVDVFHRYSQDPNGYFMVQHSACGILHPSVGWTDGWTQARISEAWNISRYNASDYRTWVE